MSYSVFANLESDITGSLSRTSSDSKHRDDDDTSMEDAEGNGPQARVEFPDDFMEGADCGSDGYEEMSDAEEESRFSDII